MRGVAQEVSSHREAPKATVFPASTKQLLLGPHIVLLAIVLLWLFIVLGTRTSKEMLTFNWHLYLSPLVFCLQDSPQNHCGYIFSSANDIEFAHPSQTPNTGSQLWDLLMSQANIFSSAGSKFLNQNLNKPKVFWPKVDGPCPLFRSHFPRVSSA